MNQQTAATETVQVHMNADFMDHLTAWHENKVSGLKHMMNIPEGTQVVYGDDVPIALTGDLLKGYIIGVSIGLSEFGQLPFTTVVECSEAKE